MGDKLDKELRSKFASGFKHAKENVPAMKEHGTKSHASAYGQGYRFGSSTKSPDELSRDSLKEHQLEHWKEK